MNTWTLTIIEDPDTKELVLPLTEEILSTVGWKEGDVLVWRKKDHQSWTLKKKVDTTVKKSV
jgi:hypothetical protein